jgi:hypothetical protein
VHGRSFYCNPFFQLPIAAAIMSKNITMNHLDSQFRNQSVLLMVAEFLCHPADIAKPVPDLFCYKFPIDHSVYVSASYSFHFVLHMQ